MLTPLDDLPKIRVPPTRALHEAGYASLREVAGAPRAELARLHGIGHKALHLLEQALGEHGLTLS